VHNQENRLENVIKAKKSIKLDLLPKPIFYLNDSDFFFLIFFYNSFEFFPNLKKELIGVKRES
jgi:hypothetical protein